MQSSITMSGLFTESDTWTGGAVELLLLLDSVDAADALEGAAAAWRWGPIDGPYPTNDREPWEQSKVSVRDVDADALFRLYGTASLPNDTVAAFCGGTIMEEDAAWLSFGLPVGGLGRCYPVGAYPFSGSVTQPWVLEIYAWLADLARWIVRSVAVRAGVIGWLTALESEELLAGHIPQRRYHGYLLAQADGLGYLAPNVDEPLIR